jgi:xylulokinase
VPKLVIGIDSGTQSTKAVLVESGSGVVVASASAPHDMIPSLPPGHKEQDPAGWLRAVERTIDQLLGSRSDEASAVVAIGVSGQQHGLVPLDAGDHVIRPAKLWSDTSTTSQCDEITERLGGVESAIAATGNAILPGYTAPKILWLKQYEPQHYARLATVLLPHDYIVFWLTGRKVMEHGDASGTALMDVRRREWSRTAIEAVDPALGQMLPVLRHSGRPAGTLRPELARRWGLEPGVIVSGSGDNMMAAIGTGNVRPGVVTASLGTSGTVYACADQPVVDPNGEVAAFCDATGKWLPLACTMNVTVATEMVRRRLGLDLDSFSQLAATVQPGSGGLLLLPFFEGERTPHCPEGTGVLFGVREHTADAGHLARAAMEGATLGMNYGLGRLRALGIAPTEIRLTGGGSKSAVWRQIAADVFDCGVVCLAGEEGAASGAAIHALWVYENEHGKVVPLEQLTDELVRPDESTRALPEASRTALYKEMQRLFDRLAADLRGAFSLHRAILGSTR